MEEFHEVGDLPACCPRLECLRVCFNRTTEDVWEPLTRLSHLKDLTLEYKGCRAQYKPPETLQQIDLDNFPMLQTSVCAGHAWALAATPAPAPPSKSITANTSQ